MSTAIDKIDGEGSRVIILADTPKGTYISDDELEAVTGLERGSARYHFAREAMISRFHLDTARAGAPKFCHRKGGGITVMTDEQAVDYFPRRFGGHWIAMNRAHERLGMVSGDNLTSVQLAAKDRELANQSRVLAAGWAEHEKQLTKGEKHDQEPTQERCRGRQDQNRGQGRAAADPGG